MTTAARTRYMRRAARCAGGCRLGFVDDSPLEEREIRILGPAVEERPFRRAPYGFFRGNLQNVRSLPMTIRHTEGLNIMPPLTRDRFESCSLQRRVHCEPNFLAFYRTATTCFSTIGTPPECRGRHRNCRKIGGVKGSQSAPIGTPQFIRKRPRITGTRESASCRAAGSVP
jgi:hypothetical protein